MINLGLSEQSRSSTHLVFSGCSLKPAQFYRVAQKSSYLLVKLIHYITYDKFDLKNLSPKSELSPFIGLLSPFVPHHCHNIC